MSDVLSGEALLLDAATKTKKKLVEMTGLSPEHMLVLGSEPNARGMTLESHGWAQEPGTVELVAEECGDLIETAWDAVSLGYSRVEAAPTVPSCVFVFYEV
jgi:hypothetical protein